MKRFGGIFKWLYAASLLALALGGLHGCAGGAGGAGGASASKPDMITESDEPEARKRARLRLELASNYFEQGQTTVALDELKQALITDPTLPDAYNLRGLIYMRLNDPRLAEESFRRAIQLNPASSDALHNYGWMMCEQRRYPESFATFNQALSNPLYGNRPKTLLTLGLCQERAGLNADAERSLARSYELDAANPITGYNLSNLLFMRGDFVRAQFYIRRLNNSELANAESLWLGIKVERRMDDRDAMLQLAEQLRKRFPKSTQYASYERGAFSE